MHRPPPPPAVRRALLGASLWLVLAAACSGGPGDPQPDAGPDAGLDAGADAGADAGPDAGPDAGEPVVITPNTAGWWRDRTFYEVFVRSFADSDGDGVGDLKGLTAKLDVLNDGSASSTSDLGVDALWLMPIFASPSYHGYDVTDYRAVNPAYGTLADFDALAAAAHQRGMKVILDMVLNHSGSGHQWFVNSRTGPSAYYRNWYLWRDADPHWTKPWGGSPWSYWNGYWYYALFWSGMPDLNLGNPAVEAELLDSMKFWLAHGADGFRLDAVRHYFESSTGVLVDQPETHQFLRRIRYQLHRDYPQALLVGEAWTSEDIVASYYGQGDEVQLAFSFDAADALVAAASAGAAAPLIAAVSSTEAALAGKDRGFEAPFLTNHDQVRALRAMGGNPALARLAAAALLALPGTPFLYYGEEIGMQGGPSGADEDKRTPLRWTSTGPGYGFTTGTPWRAGTEAAGVDVATQRADPGSLWNLYRRLLAQRHALPPLATGAASRPTVTGGGSGLFALLRIASNKRVLFVANFAPTPTGSFAVQVAGTPVPQVQEGLGLPVVGGASLTFPGLEPRSFAYLTLD